VAERGLPETVEDLADRFDDLPDQPWGAPPHQARVLPIARPGRQQLAGVLVLGISPRRAFDDDYQGFFALVAGHVATVVANARAYEGEKERAEKLAEIDLAKTVFFSNVSHEFRTPLTLMLGPLEDTLSRSKGLLPPEDLENLAVAHRSSLRLLKLVNALLDFSRIEAGRIEAVYEPTDLASLTADLASVFRSTTEKAGLELIVDTPPLREPVYVDHEMWEKIVLNLISNAFKFTMNGRITVRQYAVDDHVELSVEDTGCGIPESEMGNVFKRFYRIKGTEGRTHEGTGIGLALVDELVKFHGGSVGVASRFGEGATFTVSIPFGTAHLPTDRIGAERTTVSSAVRAASYVDEALRWLPEGEHDAPVSPECIPVEGPLPRILLADDNADMREYIRKLLCVHYDVVAVSDGEAAWEAVLDGIRTWCSLM
jgi:signal transduction histidine kinase